MFFKNRNKIRKNQKKCVIFEEMTVTKVKKISKNLRNDHRKRGKKLRNKDHRKLEK